MFTLPSGKWKSLSGFWGYNLKPLVGLTRNITSGSVLVNCVKANVSLFSLSGDPVSTVYYWNYKYSCKVIYVYYFSIIWLVSSDFVVFIFKDLCSVGFSFFYINSLIIEGMMRFRLMILLLSLMLPAESMTLSPYVLTLLINILTRVWPNLKSWSTWSIFSEIGYIQAIHW